MRPENASIATRIPAAIYTTGLPKGLITPNRARAAAYTVFEMQCSMQNYNDEYVTRRPAGAEGQSDLAATPVKELGGSDPTMPPLRKDDLVISAEILNKLPPDMRAQLEAAIWAEPTDEEELEDDLAAGAASGPAATVHHPRPRLTEDFGPQTPGAQQPISPAKPAACYSNVAIQRFHDSMLNKEVNKSWSKSYSEGSPSSTHTLGDNVPKDLGRAAAAATFRTWLRDLRVKLQARGVLLDLCSGFEEHAGDHDAIVAYCEEVMKRQEYCTIRELLVFHLEGLREAVLFQRMTPHYGDRVAALRHTIRQQHLGPYDALTFVLNWMEERFQRPALLRLHEQYQKIQSAAEAPYSSTASVPRRLAQLFTEVTMYRGLAGSSSLTDRQAITWCITAIRRSTSATVQQDLFTITTTYAEDRHGRCGRGQVLLTDFIDETTDLVNHLLDLRGAAPSRNPPATLSVAAATRSDTPDKYCPKHGPCYHDVHSCHALKDHQEFIQRYLKYMQSGRKTKDKKPQMPDGHVYFEDRPARNDNTGHQSGSGVRGRGGSARGGARGGGGSGAGGSARSQKADDDKQKHRTKNAKYREQNKQILSAYKAAVAAQAQGTAAAPASAPTAPGVQPSSIDHSVVAALVQQEAVKPPVSAPPPHYSASAAVASTGVLPPQQAISRSIPHYHACVLSFEAAPTTRATTRAANDRAARQQESDRLMNPADADPGPPALIDPDDDNGPSGNTTTGSGLDLLYQYELESPTSFAAHNDLETWAPSLAGIPFRQADAKGGAAALRYEAQALNGSYGGMDDGELLAAEYIKNTMGVVITTRPQLIRYAKTCLYLLDPGANVSVTNDPTIVCEATPHLCTIGGVNDSSVIYGTERGLLRAKTVIWTRNGTPQEFTMPEIPFVVVAQDQPLAFKIISYKDVRNIPNFKVSIDNEYVEIDGYRQDLLRINGQLFIAILPRLCGAAEPQFACFRDDTDFVIAAAAFQDLEPIRPADIQLLRTDFTMLPDDFMDFCFEPTSMSNDGVLHVAVVPTEEPHNDVGRSAYDSGNPPEHGPGPPVDLQALAIDAVEPPKDFMMIHQQFGHVNAVTCGNIGKALGIPGAATWSSTYKDFVCWSCCLAKMKKVSRGRGCLGMHAPNDWKAGPLRVLCVDIFVVNRLALTGAMYAAILTCPFSDRQFVVGLHKKSDIPEGLRAVIRQARSLCGWPGTIVIYCDNEPVLNSKDQVSAVLREENAVLWNSADFESRTNPFVERSIGVLTVMARTFMTTAGFPPSFWLLMLKHAAWVRAQIRTPAREQAPCELFENLPPRHTFLRVPGCLAFGLVPAHSRSSKFDFTAEPSVYISTAAIVDKAGFLLYSIKRKVFYVTASARFDQSRFPFLEGLLDKAADAAFYKTTAGDVTDELLHLPTTTSDAVEPSDNDTTVASDPPRPPVLDSSSSNPLAVLPDGTSPLELYGRSIKKPFRKGRGKATTTYKGVITGHQVAPEGQIYMRIKYDDDGYEEYYSWQELQPLLVDEETVAVALHEQMEPSRGGAGGLLALAARETTTTAPTAPASKRFPTATKAKRKGKHRSNETTFTDISIAIRTYPEKKAQIEAAARLEYEKFKEMDVFGWTELRPGEKPMPLKMPGKIKGEADLHGEVFRMRLCAMGNFAVAPDGGFTSYAPVASQQHIMFLLSLITGLGLHARTADAVRGFLWAPAPRDRMIYRPPPNTPWFDSPERWDKDGNERFLLAKRAIYGDVESNAAFHRLWRGILEDFGFTTIDAAGCFFMFTEGDVLILVASVVDDSLIGHNSEAYYKKFVDYVNSRIKIDEGPLKKFVGLEIDYDREAGIMKIRQQDYIELIAQRFGITKEDATDVPIPTGSVISKADCPDHVNQERSTLGRSMVGSTAYAQATHPGIRFSVSQLSCIMHNPAEKHIKVARQTTQYLFNQRHKPIVYRRQRWQGPDGTELEINEFATFVDSSYAPPGGEGERRSQTGFAVLMNGAVIYAKSGVQATVADSSAYAELIAMHHSVKETMAFRNTYEKMGMLPTKPTKIFQDNTAAISVAQTASNSSRLRHAEIKYNYTHDLVQRDLIDVVKIHTRLQLADALTKALDAQQHSFLETWLHGDQPEAARAAAEEVRAQIQTDLEKRRTAAAAVQGSPHYIEVALLGSHFAVF